jgi:tRNA pseudouridine55 synthase
MVSAIKVGGRRLHELARAGEDVERAPRKVHISEIVVGGFEPGPYPEVSLTVECSSGTYIRSLAADLGTALGGCAHLGALRRERVGSFGLTESRLLPDIEASPEEAMLAPVVAVRDLEQVRVAGEQVRAIAHGATFAANALVPERAGPGPFAVIDERDRLLAVYERRGAGVKPAVVCVTEDASR